MVLLRRLRGLAGFALFWSVAWLPLGFLVTLFDSIVRDRGLTLSQVVSTLPRFASYGFLAGLAFGLLFALVERRRTFAELSLSRFMVWAAVGAAQMPVVDMLVRGVNGYAALWTLTIAELAVPGALLAMTTLLIARRAPRALESGIQPRELRGSIHGAA